VVDVFQRSWNLDIVAAGARGVCRFDDFQQQLGISRKVLAERLKWLTGAEILVRSKYRSAPDRYEYLLTDKGRDLLPILTAMKQWEERWAH
jgi:DNA-binding HxlR family transcriptional regulator